MSVVEPGPEIVANDAGRLVRAGLNPKFRPARDADYAGLVLRYQSDPAFARLVRSYAGGQGLSVLACDRMEGIVFAPTDDSPFRVRLADYIGITSSDMRLLHGLVQLAIAATAYPTAAALEDSLRLPSVTASQVYDRLRRLIDDARTDDGSADPPEDAPELEPVWRMLGRLRAADTTPDGRDTPYNVMGAIRKAFRWLESRGMADEVAGSEDTWRLRERYRLSVQFAAVDAVDVLRSTNADGAVA